MCPFYICWSVACCIAGLLRNNSVMSFTNSSFINTTDDLNTESGWRESWTPLDRPKTVS